MSQNLFGDYYVKPTGTAVARAWRLCQGSVRDYQILRRHALRLAFWPDGGGDEQGLDWDWIVTLEKLRIGELRVDEVVAGLNNIRIIFFKADKVLSGDLLPRIWTMTVFQKKQQGFSAGEKAAFRQMRQLIVARYYDGAQDA